MALGNTYNNNSQKKDTSPSVYSYYKMSNPTSKVDQTNLGFSFWKGLLKISIAPRKQTNDDTIAFDYENQIAIHLSHSKAAILAAEIRRFIAGCDNRNCGVSTNKGCIYICDGSEFGSKSTCLVIKLIDEIGNVQSAIAYEFNTNYHFAIRDFDEATKNFEKITEEYNNREIEELLAMLDNYCAAVTNAVAYTVIDANHYNTNKMLGNFSAIAEKLGVELGKKSTIANYSSKSSFFNANSGMNSTGGKATATSYDSYDDLAAELD